MPSSAAPTQPFKAKPMLQTVRPACCKISGEEAPDGSRNQKACQLALQEFHQINEQLSRRDANHG
jgi:hypothetical protein